MLEHLNGEGSGDLESYSTSPTLEITCDDFFIQYGHAAPSGVSSGPVSTHPRSRALKFFGGMPEEKFSLLYLLYIS